MYWRPPPSPPFPTRRSSDLRRPPGRDLEDNHALGDMDLRRGQTDAADILQGFQHVGDEPADFQRGGIGDGIGNPAQDGVAQDRKSTRLNSSHANISYAVFCL